MHATWKTCSAIVGLVVAATMSLAAGPVWANHPVTVEGNCFGPGSGATATGLRKSPVEPGTCGDYDGDGLIGTAEDNDLDNNFGTINAALAAVAQNGTVTIVANGTFPEAVSLKPTEGASVTLEGAPGVRANIDAVVQGESGNAERQGQHGVRIRGCAACRVTLRNITVRNFTQGINVGDRSRALLQGARVEGNLNYGIRAIGATRVAIHHSTVNATGFRKDAVGVAEAKPGIGVRIGRDAKASIFRGVISNNRSAGIRAHRGDVELRGVQVFGNKPNYDLRG
jgi:hypothetical protein